MVKDIANEFMFSALQIFTLDDTRSHAIGSGTGFAFALRYGKDKIIPVLVTNKHVLSGCSYIAVIFTCKKEDGGPDIGNTVQVTIATKDSKEHDTQDLAVLPLGGALDALKKANKQPFCTVISEDIILTAEEWKSLNAVEHIIAFGYPDGLRDDKNNLPIIRSGTTATHPSYDFQGRPEFLADIPCYYGSSGSPVFVLKNNQLFLIGIEYKMRVIRTETPLPNGLGTLSGVKIPLQVPANLAQVIKSSELLSLASKLLLVPGDEPDTINRDN